MRFYTIQKLGPKRSLTPEGFLLCEDVPVARTGEMLYAAGEVPIEAGPDGLIRISRTPEEVFRDETMASCMGKDITLDHPEDFVQPSNYAGLTQGVMLNPRRSTLEPDLLVADLLIKHPDTITAVQDEEIEEVSLGYEADYEQVSPGRGVQRNIVVNHVAIVPRGRCGPRCAIGDKEPEMKTKDSKPPRRSAWLDRLMKAMRAKDAEGVEEALEEGQKAMDEESEEERKKSEAAEAGKTGDALSQILTRLKAMDEDIQELKKAVAEDDDEDEDDEPTGDGAGDLTEAEPSRRVSEEGVDLYTGDSARVIAARAEILAPGVKLPTLDGLKTKDRAAALCKCQRRALDQAYETDAGRAAIAPFLGRRAPDFDTMPAPVVDAIFTGAAELMRAKNNAGSSSGKVSTRDFGKVKTIADINEQNRKFWAGQSNQ
ncbi:TPA: DUF2213 domain-containing protein [Burkholderia multivorans]|uniref:DUF2213 domain-containing protein n=1 Tax=Burkholderia multivorans TaxID=87883 RepID=UPI001C2382B5|nr:DUF2213 domain-containing protein [Burkholderia multivorans]MBU9240978.1 DUF2213 domain-containing protein [Burkholderia multivorans]HEF4749743.1 DUF2213 domain-containing protein [Burkholderia multivorans]